MLVSAYVEFVIHPQSLIRLTIAYTQETVEKLCT